MGNWQTQEYFAALQRSIEERDEAGRPRMRLIPILLPGVAKKPKLPVFMRTLDYIDFRRTGIDDRPAMRRLVAAVLGRRDHLIG